VNIKFIFLGEGPSDNGLVVPLADLCIRLGATKAEAVIPSFAHLKIGHALVERVIPIGID